MLKSERQEEILRQIQQHGTVQVVALAQHLDVSEITVRRDLDALSKTGDLERIHGGARCRSPRGPEPPVVHRQTVQVRAKQAIGLAALELVHDGDIIALDSGSTTLQLARAIARHTWRNLRIVTNSFIIAEELMRTPGVQLVFIGGTVNLDEMGVYGTLAADMFKHIVVEKLFIGCRGLDPDVGLSNDVSNDAQAIIATVRAAIASARQVIVLADHTKFGHVFLIQIVPTTALDVVVTDHLAPNDIVERIRKQGTQVIVTPLEDVMRADTPGTGT